jgi:hypothetical protein
MNDDFEKQLREALCPVDPAPGFAARVSARIENQRRKRWPLAHYRWAPVALAASVLLSLILAYGWQSWRLRQGLAARQQLIEALRLTGEKLDLAYRGVQDASRPAARGDAGDT